MDRRALYFILATLCIDAIGIGIVFPILPDLMAKVGAGTGLSEGSLWAGLLMGAYAGAQFLFAPLVGSLSDAYGRKPVLLIALALLVVDYVIMALADTYWLLLLGRTMAGMAGATYLTATAYIADISTKEEKAANFGLIGAAFGIGFVLGPAIGGLAAGIHVSAPFWIAAIISALNFAFGLFILPESLKPENRRPFGWRDLNPFASILNVVKLPGLMIPLVAILIFEFANMVYPSLWAFWTKEMFGWEAWVVGLTLAIYGVLLAAVQAGLMPRLVRKFGENRTLLIGLVAAFIGMVGYATTTTVWMMAVLLPIAALSDLSPTLLTARASNLSDDDKQGLVQGVIASLSSVAAVFGPLFATWVFAHFAAPDAGVYWPGAPFAFSAVLVIAVFLLTRPDRAD
ncbi:MAG: TCR/Tet family MFS transporter [Pseudomonadota bacterium]